MVEVSGKSYPTITDLLSVPEEKRNSRDYIDGTAGIFLVISSVTRTTANDKKYTDAIVADPSKTEKVKVWSDGVKGGDLLFAHYDYNPMYRSFSIEPVKVVDAQSHEEIFEKMVPHFDGIEELKECLRHMIKTVKSDHLRSLLEMIFDENGEIYQKFIRATAASNNHHVGRGGLLFHTVSVAKNALNLLCNYPALNRDLVLAGCLLHDVGKVETYTYGPQFEYTDAGKLENHIVIGLKTLAVHIERIPDFPKELDMVLTNILTSHHGALEYGSPILPKTPEAMLVSFADNIDAKMRMAVDAVKTIGEGWSDRIVFLKTELFKYREK